MKVHGIEDFDDFLVFLKKIVSPEDIKIMKQADEDITRTIVEEEADEDEVERATSGVLRTRNPVRHSSHNGSLQGESSRADFQGDMSDRSCRADHQTPGKEEEREPALSEEKPILFNQWSVRKLRARQKTETRRLIKPQPDFAEQPYWKYGENGHSGSGWYCCESEYPEEGSQHYVCRYRKGDHLYVRETARVVEVIKEGQTITDLEIKYEADQATATVEFPSRLRSKPKVGHCLAYGCYREASRIRLEVTESFPQKLQDMKDKDAKAEGCQGWECGSHVSGQDVGPIDWETPLEEYISVWDIINPGHPFNSKKPKAWWVWVIRFKVLSL